ncbi:MAG: PulJ/GspJ family protein [Limisphaerales bacterium]
MAGFCCSNSRTGDGFTLVEVMVSLAVLVLMGGGILASYIQSAQITNWQAYSLAAQSLVIQRVEQCRAAKWDTRSFPPVDELVGSNFPVLVEAMDMPITRTNATYATNYTTISNVSVDPPLRMIQVNCIWQFTNGKIFTNTVVTYRAPDQ